MGRTDSKVGEMWRDQGPGALPWSVGGHKMGEPLQKTAWQFLRRLNTELLHGSVILHVGIFPTELNTGTRGQASTQMVTAALFTTAERGQHPKRSRGMDKRDMVHS